MPQRFLQRLVDEWDAGNANGMSTAQQLEWLHRSNLWPAFPPYWKPVRILGAGGNGLAGLWKNTGRNRASRRFPRYVVVKQMRDPAGLNQESRFMRMLRQTGTQHVVKLYRGAHAVPGSGTSLRWDPLGWNAQGVPVLANDVARIYMEFCEGGGLDDHITKDSFLNHPFPEEYIWRLIKCIADAFYMLERGTYAPGPNWSAIAHFDVKPDNIFIGGRDEGDHRRLPVFKVLADFGLSLQVPGTGPPPAMAVNLGVQSTANPNWIAEAEWRTTSGWTPPEQAKRNHPERDIGSPTAIWQLGAIVYMLITTADPQDTRDHPAGNLHPNGSKIVQTRTKYFKVSLPDGRRFRTAGRYLMPYARSQYSWELIETIYRCLAYRPSERMTASELLAAATAAVAAYDQVNTQNHTNDIRTLDDTGRRPGNVIHPNSYIYDPLTHSARGPVYKPGNPLLGFGRWVNDIPPVAIPRWNSDPDFHNNMLLWGDNLAGYAGNVNPYIDFAGGRDVAVPPQPAPPAPAGNPAPVANPAPAANPAPPRPRDEVSYVGLPWLGGRRRWDRTVHAEPF